MTDNKRKNKPIKLGETRVFKHKTTGKIIYRQCIGFNLDGTPKYKKVSKRKAEKDEQRIRSARVPAMAIASLAGAVATVAVSACLITSVYDNVKELTISHSEVSVTNDNSDSIVYISDPDSYETTNTYDLHEQESVKARYRFSSRVPVSLNEIDPLILPEKDEFNGNITTYAVDSAANHHVDSVVSMTTGGESNDLMAYQRGTEDFYRQIEEYGFNKVDGSRLLQMKIALEPYEDIIAYQCYKHAYANPQYTYDVPMEWVERLIYRESKGDANAYNGHGNGLAQIEDTLMPDFIQYVSTNYGIDTTSRDAYNVEYHIDYVVNRLQYLVNYYEGDYIKATQAWNFDPSSLNLLINEFGDSWLEHTHEMAYYNGHFNKTGKTSYGDPNYVENVFQLN